MKINGLTFHEFMAQVEHEIAVLVGMSSAELPQQGYPYMVAWQAGMDPIQAAREALSYNNLV